jgi:hypothetical protein
VVEEESSPFQQQYSSCVGSGMAPSLQFRLSCDDDPPGHPCHPASLPHPSQKQLILQSSRCKLLPCEPEASCGT